VKILVVHEVNYLSKIIYEFQILPEILSLLGHDITVVDFNDSWQSEGVGRRFTPQTVVYRNVHRAYAKASLTVRRPGFIRLPVLSRLSGSLFSTLEVIRTLKDDRPDVVLLYGLPTIGVQTVLAARTLNVPVVFRAIDVSHELVPHPMLRIPAKLTEHFVFNSVDLNIALTPHLKSYIQAHDVPESRIRLLPSGVDTTMFSPGPRDAQVLARWGIDPDDRVVLFMGTLYRFSGLDRVIQGFSEVLAVHMNAKLLIVGSGEAEEKLRMLAAAKGFDRQVVFTGVLPYSDLPALIRSSDVCINPFELNGITQNILPTKLFQYMTCEKPVLATPLPGTLTFLAGEEQGVVYASIDTFNRRLIDLLSDAPYRARLGLKAATAAKMYDWFEIARTLISWLKQIAQ